MTMSESDDEPYQATQHWGEITNEKVEDHVTLSCVLEDIKRSMQHNCLDSYPDDENVMKVTEIYIPPADPLVLHAIELHKWMSKMKETIKAAKECKSRTKPASEDVRIPIPEMPSAKLTTTPNSFNFLPPDLPKKVECPELSHAIVKQMLLKYVALMAAHIGLEDSFQSVLDVLVDAFEQCLIKICERFTSAYREHEDLGTTGFPNLIERVLVELGFGGAKGLHNFYQSRVVKYAITLEKRCQKLEKEYLVLITPKSKASTDAVEKSLGVKNPSNLLDSDLESGSSEEEITLHSSKYFKDSEIIDMILQ